uniref:CS domain-containing protein n=1 Tax=Heterorhabditis bacteriophora TaxID=37862 RepID=A0A1I7WSU3_HETBA
MSTRQPLVIWAQRESFLFVTIEVDEANIEDLTADTNKLHFNSKTDVFETTLEFFDEIIGNEVKRSESNTRVVELTIPKKEQKWWPRLLKEKGKVHWLKVDFSKWKDEDDSGAEEGLPAGDSGFDLNQYMSQMGGGMGGGATDFDGLDDDDDDGGSWFFLIFGINKSKWYIKQFFIKYPVANFLDMPDLEDNEEEPEPTKSS